jgi:hypothetical protein
VVAASANTHASAAVGAFVVAVAGTVLVRIVVALTAAAAVSCTVTVAVAVLVERSQEYRRFVSRFSQQCVVPGAWGSALSGPRRVRHSAPPCARTGASTGTGAGGAQRARPRRLTASCRARMRVCMRVCKVDSVGDVSVGAGARNKDAKTTHSARGTGT